MTDKEMIEQFLADAVVAIVRDAELKWPIKVVNIDMGGHTSAAFVKKDGSYELLADPSRGRTEPTFPIHTLIVDNEGNCALFVTDENNEQKRALLEWPVSRDMQDRPH